MANLNDFLIAMVKDRLGAEGKKALLGIGSTDYKDAQPTMKIRGNSHDTRSMSDLKAARFSGLRANDLWNRFELWILGNCDTTLTYNEFALNPSRLNKLYCETFGLEEVAMEEHVVRAQQEVQYRMEQMKALPPQQQDAMADERAKNNREE